MRKSILTIGLISIFAGDAVVGARDALACTTGSCATYTETGTNADALQGISSTGNGVSGSTTSGTGVAGLYTGNTSTCSNNLDGVCAGVYGSSVEATYPGVWGQGAATGVYGKGSTYGVYGTGTTTGVYGTGTFGVQGVSSGGYGLFGNGGSGGVGVSGEASGAGNGVVGTASGTGDAGNFDETGTGYAIYATGKIYATGTITQNSDLRLKKNIEPLKGALDQLLGLKGVTFEWKDPKEHPGMEGTNRGFIAQDVEKVFPSWVGEDHKGFKTLDTHQIEALEVESIRTLKAENDDLRARMDRMENGGNPARAGFTYGNGGWGVAGLALGMMVVSRRKMATKQS